MNSMLSRNLKYIYATVGNCNFSNIIRFNLVVKFLAPSIHDSCGSGLDLDFKESFKTGIRNSKISSTLKETS